MSKPEYTVGLPKYIGWVRCMKELLGIIPYPYYHMRKDIVYTTQRELKGKNDRTHFMKNYNGRYT